jgi:hypothetical protein
MLDYNTRFIEPEIDLELERRERLEDLRYRTNKWFTDNWLVHKLINKYEYFGTFNFEPYWTLDKTFEDLQDSIKHFKSILRRKMFGRNGDFNMNFYPVIETVKWIKEYKKYVPVRKHVHILFGGVPDTVRLNKDFETFIIDCWMSLKECGERDEQQVIPIYGTDTRKCGEGYITKLKHSNVDWFDKKNFTEIKNQHLLDEDITDYIERNSDGIFDSTVLKD